jgi:Cys-tRNA(Pro)/Cys-tRNA(Cys) deacylase
MAAPKSATPKTNAVRLLEAAGLAFKLHSYEHDDDHLDAPEVARRIGLEADRVFKTLVAVDDAGRHLVFVLPGSCELNLKKAAKAAGSRKVELIRLADLTGLTGYIRGGCSPLGMKKPLPTWMDETAQLFERVVVSAGLRGLQVELAPADLLAACRSHCCPLAEFADLI